MITIMRKHHKWLMIVIAILAIPFIFYFNKTSWGVPRVNDIGRIYDRPVTQVEFQRSARLLSLAQALGLTMWHELTAGAQSEADLYVNFTFNRLVLKHEAQKLGIQPTDKEIENFVQTLRPFRGDTGNFDPNKYTEFTQTRLPSLGFKEAQVEELISDQLSLNRVKELLGTGLQVAESESMEYYQQTHGKLQVAVVRFRQDDFQKDVKITDEDIAKYYEAHKAELKNDEKRKVEFVAFTFSEEEKKLTGKERIDALQKLANRANDMVQGLLDKSAKFSDVAAKFNAPVQSTGEFTAAAPDPLLAPVPQLTQYAFQLTTQDATSDAIQGPEGFYVMHLVGTVPGRPLTLDEAKPKITEALQKEKLHQLVANKGADTARVIREALRAGTPLDTAMNQSGLQVERIPVFSIVESATPTPAPSPALTADKDKPVKAETPDLPMIKNAVAELNPGDSTDFVATDKGGLVAVLEKRDPADPADYPKVKTTFETSYLQSKRAAVFDEWLQDRRQAAQVQLATS
jgi:hypothetical protein